MALDKQPTDQLINVHRVNGDKDAILFLKNSEKDYVEGLFYHAKKYGISDFYFRDLKYQIRRNKDFSFTVELSPEQELSSEQFA